MKNKLTWDGVDLKFLAEHYGTPLYVYSITIMEEKIKEIKEAFTDKYPGARVAYAGKAFLNKAMVGFLKSQGLYLDVVSKGELQLALEAGMNPEHIEFNGNNKLEEEIDYAVKNKVGRIIIDGAEEIDLIEKYAQIYGYKVPVLFRVTPGIDIDSHQYIVTGRKDSKFGFSLDQDLIPHIIRAQKSNFLDFYGLHFHLGSQLMAGDIYLEALDMLFVFIDENLNKRDIKELNIGGGFGINYLPQDQAKSFNFFFEPIIKKIKDYFGDKLPQLVTEPGRSIVGEAGITLYRVGDIKKIPGIKNYLAVDGGMADNIRPALYGAHYHGKLIGKSDEEEVENYTIVGKCCESGDIVIHDIKLPLAKRGDLLAVFSTGAYGYSMASNYNLLAKPAIVWLKKGEHYLVTKAQEISQIYENDLDFPL